MHLLQDDRASLEWLILCDSAEVLNNKLYMMGGGWEIYSRQTEAPVSFALAASVRVPWNATNQKHPVRISVLNEDTRERVADIGADIEVGRPPGIPPGAAQRVQLAVKIDANLPPADYVIQCSIDGQDQPDRQVLFRIVAGPGFRPPEPPAS